MHSKNDSAAVGTRSLLIILSGTLIFAASLVGAEPVATINGATIDSSVFALYVESRAQRPISDLADADQQTLLSELVDLYILSTQPGAADLKKDPRVAAQIELQERAIVAQAFATKFLTDNVATDEEIAEEYAIQSAAAPDLQFKARHILVPTQGEAIDLIAKLDSGSDFATLAMDSSTGPSAKDGGALPWFSPNQMVKPFSDAVAALEDGKYTSAPVQTEFGWHVILREESRANEPPPLESIRENIKQNVAQKKFQAHLEVLRSDAASND
jgi:peptidyl-prolyl cis-trans isomerase C